MRVSYGSIGGYRPYDAAWYDYYTTQKGIFEKENPESDEFWVQPEILNLIRSKDFGQYANKDGELQLCFLSNNDITGGNSGSPVFDKNARLIGLASMVTGKLRAATSPRTGFAAHDQRRHTLCALHDRQVGEMPAAD